MRACNSVKIWDRTIICVKADACPGFFCRFLNITTDMVLAGDSVLAEATMLNPSRVMTYAVYVKSFAKEKLVNELVDPDEQIRVELWEYDPKQFSEDNMADRLSVALSFLKSTAVFLGLWTNREHGASYPSIDFFIS